MDIFRRELREKKLLQSKAEVEIDILKVEDDEPSEVK
jgi:hypothetical protein